jgi:hypothetical protein
MKNVRTTASALIIRSEPKIAGGTDTGARIMAGQVVPAWGQTFDGGWMYVDAPAGRGWASASLLEEAAPGDAPDTTKWPPVPHGLVAIRKTFGEPGGPRAQAGRVKMPASLPLSWDPKKTITSFACHELVADPMEGAFREVHRRGLWTLLEDWGGCYNDRTARGLGKKSTHAWGIAVDVAANSNPLGRKPKLDKQIVAIFEDHNFLWGGRWSRPDGMHFQYATGY